MTGRVAIVGAGLIGRAWGTVFARAGWAVALTDPDAATLAGAPGAIAAELAMLASHGLGGVPGAGHDGDDHRGDAGGGAGGGGPGAGERSGDGGGEDGAVCGVGCAGAGRGDPGVVDVGDRCVTVHGGAGGPGAVPGGASRQSAASHSAGGAMRGALDVARDDRAGAGDL